MAYTAYGHLSALRLTSTHLGFNGELRDPHTRWYLLGNGYRAYNPVLMRFHSPDKLSPFGAGGLNSYMYCAADPINHRDPTGRFAIPGFLISLGGYAGGISSFGGIGLSLTNSARFSGQGTLALGTGAAGVLLGAAVIANPATAIAPVLASVSMVAGGAGIALGYRTARAATATGTQWFQSVARSLDNPPRYSTLSLLDQPPSFSSLDLSPPPPYSPPRVSNQIAPTHSTVRTTPQQPGQRASSTRHQKTILETTQMRELPRLQFIDETKSAGKKIRTP
ncbi:MULTISPECIES: RHS repeat-associated core domain-containing protein [unclassified Pseudomonas]|nr:MULTISPECIES: RHS repeat-associated core domain-containing protein [unclassified Pseudomonas]